MREPHLFARFRRSLWWGRPSHGDLEWALECLNDEEAALFARMSRTDQRHAINGARYLDNALVPNNTQRAQFLEATLMHDIGKLDAGLRVFGRTIATVAGWIVPHRAVEVWRHKNGFRRKIALYLSHPEIGADRLRLVGGSDIAVWWAMEHHHSDAFLAQVSSDDLEVLRTADRF